jgi:hypothetical protein
VPSAPEGKLQVPAVTQDVLKAALAALDRGERVALLTIVPARGSTPLPVAVARR